MRVVGPLARLIGAVWMVALALVGLGVAMYCFAAVISLGSARPDRLLHLPSVRGRVGRFLDQISAPGSAAGLALLCGLGAMLLGILLITGVLGRRKQRLAILEHEHQQGAVAARPKPLRDMTQALAEQARGATSVKRPKLSLSRRGTRGRLRVNATRTHSSDPKEVTNAVISAVQPITEPFHLQPRVRIRLGESGSRTQ
jgi:hypothetical protein